MFPRITFVRYHDFISDDEKQLSKIGIVIETDDQGEITKAELFGPRICDRNLLLLRALDGIPLVQIGNTSLSEIGRKRLAAILPSSNVEDMNES